MEPLHAIPCDQPCTQIWHRVALSASSLPNFAGPRELLQRTTPTRSNSSRKAVAHLIPSSQPTTQPPRDAQTLTSSQTTPTTRPR